jgi:hypothetical protein
VVEGVQPIAPPAPTATSKHRRKWILLALAVVIVVAAVSVYILTWPPPIPLTIKDGSTTGLIEGNLKSAHSGNPLVLNFTATTYANQTAAAASTLTLRALTLTDSESGNGSGTVWTYLFVTVQGEFASDLDLTGLRLAYNGTGAFGDAVGRASPGPYTITRQPNPNITWAGPMLNVSYNTDQFSDTNSVGYAALTPTYVNETGKGPFYKFAFSAIWQAQYPLGSSGYFALRASVTGDFAQSVSVGILLHVIDVSA